MIKKTGSVEETMIGMQGNAIKKLSLQSLPKK